VMNEDMNEDIDLTPHKRILNRLNPRDVIT
jgi:hypothetical protein